MKKRNFEIRTEIRASVFQLRFLTGTILLVMIFLAKAFPYRAWLVESGGSLEGTPWIAVFLYSISSDTALLFLPLTVPLAAAGKAQEQLKSRYVLFLTARAGKKRYLEGKIWGAALSGGAMVIAAMVILIAILIPWCADIPDLTAPMAMESAQTEVTSFAEAGIQLHLAVKSLLPCMVCGFLNGAFWALAGSGAAVITRNPYLGYALPFILYYVFTVFQERYYRDLYFLSPRQWAYPSRYGAGVCAGILLALGAAAALLLRKVMERRLTG